MTNQKHVNPNCKDSSLCEPHGEIGEVTYKEETWQDRFDKEMPKIIGGHGFGEDCFLYDSCNKLQELKSFIQSEIDSAVSIALDKQREEIMEKIEKEKITIRPGGILDKSLDNAHTYGYNQALEDIKNII